MMFFQQYRYVKLCVRLVGKQQELAIGVDVYVWLQLEKTKILIICNQIYLWVFSVARTS